MYNLLNGVRVLDLTAVVLGPFATQYLGDFGADVIKVEPPAGDNFRYVRPARSEDMGAGFLNLNRNKRSVCLDLKSEEDQSQFQKLLGEADVLVHNMRPAAAKRLGLDPAELHQENPRLIYCVAPGYSSRGRNADKPAYDDIIQAASGIAALNKGAEEEPRYIPTIVCDKVSGMHLAMAVLAGIAHQARTGQGCFIEAPMFEGMVSFLMAEQLAGETFQPAKGGLGYERLLSPNRRPHRTSDGYIGVLPYTGKHWFRVLEFLDHTLVNEAWVMCASQRSARINELYEVLAKHLPTRTTEQWLSIFNELDIPCTPVNSMEDLLTDKQLQDVEFFREIKHPTEGNIRSIRTPFWVDGVEQRPDTPAPSLEQQGTPVSWFERD